MKSNQRDGPVIAGGIFGAIVVAILTVVAVVTVVNKLNDNADKAYAAALNSQPMLYLQADNSQVPTMTGPDGPQNTDGTDDSNPGSETIADPLDDKSNEEDLSVEDGQTDSISAEDTENKENDSSQGDVTADVSSGEDASQDTDTNQMGSDEESDSSDMNSDSIDSTDIGSADDMNIIGLEYLSVGPDGTAVYHIVWGDILSDISRKLGFGVDELADHNKIRDVNLIYAESLLRVPVDADALEKLRQAQAQNPDGKVHASVNTGPDEEYD